MRRALLLLALIAFCPLAFGFDVTATMSATAGATSCQLVLDGSNAGTARPCGSAQSYPGLIANPGTYAFQYRSLNASGQSALSPATTVTIGIIPPPVDPTDPPTVTIACDPAPCPASIIITVTP